MEPEAPVKVIRIKSWEIRLKCGTVATFNIREDKGESYTPAHSPGNATSWDIWRWPAIHRESKVLASEIAAIDYEEIEHKEVPVYRPKKGAVRGKESNDESKETEV